MILLGFLEMEVGEPFCRWTMNHLVNSRVDSFGSGEKELL